MKQDGLDLDYCKELATEYVCNEVTVIVNANCLDSFGSISPDDIMIARDEMNTLLKIIAEIEKCRTENAVLKILYKHYDKEAVAEHMGI